MSIQLFLMNQACKSRITHPPEIMTITNTPFFSYGYTQPSVGPEDAEAPLYDPGLLAKLDWSKVTHMKGGVTNHAPGDGLRVRPLCKADYDRGKCAVEDLVWKW